MKPDLSRRGFLETAGTAVVAGAVVGAGLTAAVGAIWGVIRGVRR